MKQTREATSDITSRVVSKIQSWYSLCIGMICIWVCKAKNISCMFPVTLQFSFFFYTFLLQTSFYPKILKPCMFFRLSNDQLSGVNFFTIQSSPLIPLSKIKPKSKEMIIRLSPLKTIYLASSSNLI